MQASKLTEAQKVFILEQGEQVAAFLQDFFENGTMLIDCAPHSEILSRAIHDDLVQIADIARARLSAPRVA